MHHAWVSACSLNCAHPCAFFVHCSHAHADGFYSPLTSLLTHGLIYKCVMQFPKIWRFSKCLSVTSFYVRNREHTLHDFSLVELFKFVYDIEDVVSLDLFHVHLKESVFCCVQWAVLWMSWSPRQLMMLLTLIQPHWFFCLVVLVTEGVLRFSEVLLFGSCTQGHTNEIFLPEKQLFFLLQVGPGGWGPWVCLDAQHCLSQIMSGHLCSLEPTLDLRWIRVSSVVYLVFTFVWCQEPSGCLNGGWGTSPPASIHPNEQDSPWHFNSSQP